MKKLVFFLAIILAFSSCLEIESDTTFNENGSGTVSRKVDMSKLIALLKMSGKEVPKEMSDKVYDTSFTLENKINELEQENGKPLTEDEKAVLKNTKMTMKMNVNDDVFIMTAVTKFENYSQMKLAIAGNKTSVDNLNLNNKNNTDDSSMNFFNQLIQGSKEVKYTVEQGLIEKKYTGDLKKDSNAEAEKMIEAMSQIQAMMGGLTEKIVIHLPKPAKNVISKSNIEMSEDKKTITITTDLVESMKDPTVQDFKIEY